MIYLDTSAVRGLGKRLPTLPSIRECFTSLVTVLELVSGLRADGQYQRRRATIRALAEADIGFAPEMPDAKVDATFRLLHRGERLEDTRPAALAQLVACAHEAEDRPTFDALLVERDLVHAIDYFEAFDAHVSRTFVEKGAAGHARSRAAFHDQPPEQVAILEQLGISCSGGFPQTAWALHQWAGPQITILATAERLAEERGVPDPKAYSVPVAESYDRSIDAYFNAWSYSDTERLASGGRAERNEKMDLCHFLYLQPGDYLVTDDKRMGRTAEAIGVRARSSAWLAGLPLRAGAAS